MSMVVETTAASFEELVTTQRVGTIQADLFCAGCGYNLFSQGVVRDPHTQILLCRCPECGKFAPAGTATLADSGWRRALGGLLILLRAVLLLGLIVLALIMMGVISYMLADEMFSFVTYRLSYYETVENWHRQLLFVRMWGGVGSLVVGLLMGMIVVVGFYHWRKRYYYWFCLVPVLALLVAMGIWRWDYPNGRIHLFEPTGKADTFEQFLQQDFQFTGLQQTRDMYAKQLPTAADPAVKTQWGTYIANLDQQIEEARRMHQLLYRDFRPLPSPAAHMSCMTLLAMIGMLLGVRFGRPVVRGLLRALIPARALQAAGVLWFADGKMPPRGQNQLATPARAKEPGRGVNGSPEMNAEPKNPLPTQKGDPS